MRGKRIISLTAAVLAGAMFLTSCGGGKSATDGSGSSAKVSGVNEFPIVEEPTTLSIFCEKTASIEDITSNAFTKWYEEKTNVKIEWNLINGDVRQAINLQIASDDYSDIFQGFGFARSEQVAYYDQGVYIDIADLIDEHGYYIKEMFASDPEIEKELRHTDNKIFGLPTLELDFAGDAPYKMWVYKPWMDKLGAKIPETTDEFYELLKRFKTEDPNGNGIADEIPLAARNSRGGQIGLDMFLMNSFVTWGKYGFYNDNGKAVFAPITDEAKEGIKYMNKLYQEGLIHPDSFIMDRARVTAIAENDVPILGAATGKWTTQFTVAGADTNRMNEFVGVPPLKGPSGVKQTVYGQTDPGCTWFSITTACENPAAAIKWIDWFYSEEAYLATKATEGMRLANEGELGLDGQPAKYALDEIDGASVGDAIQNERWLSFALGYWPREKSIQLKDNTIDATRKQNAYEAYKLYDPYVVKGKIIGDFPVPSDISEEYLELRANITSAIDSGFVSFVIGEKNIETDWDAYVQNFYKLGLERYTEIIQNYIDTLK